MNNRNQIHTMTFRRIALRVGLACLLAVCGLFAAATVFAAAGEAGRAISVVPGVFVERNGTKTPLALNDPVRNTDTIITDATGRARILFQDDGAVTLGPDTSLALIEVLPEGKTPIFKAHVAQGLARFITGRIVEQNPKGFAVSTPEGTAGIRGTIFVLRTGNGQTTLYVVNATRDVVMNGVSVPGGFKMTLPGGNPMPMTPQDVALTQSIAAAPPSSRGNGAPDAPERALLAVLDENDPLTPT
ncbi:MAG: FecR domain-containing protein, partial [Desulfovibrio sp.]|nr:FecR domain-containing protein [Desulfovibrio sp.]